MRTAWKPSLHYVADINTCVLEGPPRPQKAFPRQKQAKRPTWPKEQIHAARRVPLAPLLAQRGFRLRETGPGNFKDRRKVLSIRYHTTPYTEGRNAHYRDA